MMFDSAAELFDDVEAFASRFVAFPTKSARVAFVLWCAHAHAVECFESTPRLALLSPEPGSGKTRALEVAECLTPSPLHVFSASPAAIFRLISNDETPRPTLLFDEVDAIFGRTGKGEEHEDLRGLLNAGHRSGAKIPRCVGPQHDVRFFDVYAAVALAGLGDLPDTLMTRSVVIRMRRRRPGEYVEPFRHRIHAAEGQCIADRLAAWAADNAGALTGAWPEMPPGVEDRPADVWEPLLAVADAAGGHWPDLAREACADLASAGVSREASLGIRLLADIRSVFGDRDRIVTADLLDRLHRLDESPWGDLKGKPLDARGLAFRLAQYEIKSAKVRDGDRVLQGYRREDFYDAWERYVSPTHASPEHPEQPEQAPFYAGDCVP